MVRLILHQVVSLTLAALLLVQYAPLAEWAEGMHAEACPHCTEAYCLRHARGEKCTHHHGKAHDGQHAAPAASHSTKAGSHGMDAGETAKGEARPGFRTCSPPQTLAPFVLALDKVTLDGPPVLASVVRDDLHFLPAEMLVVERFAVEYFHPPPMSL